jgi:hypothetical protein
MKSSSSTVQWFPAAAFIAVRVSFPDRFTFASTQGQTSPGGSLMPARPHLLRPEDGTPVRLRLSRTVCSAEAQVSDRVDFEALEEVRANDVVVSPQGGVARGTVTQAVPKRRMARSGKLDANIDAVRRADGGKASLRAVRGGKGEVPTGSMKGAKAATSLVVGPAAPFFFFVHGKDIMCPKEQRSRRTSTGTPTWTRRTSDSSPARGSKLRPPRLCLHRRPLPFLRRLQTTWRLWW